MRVAYLLVVASGLVSALAGIAVAVLVFAPIPFADSLDFYQRFYEAGGWSAYGIADLYARHNEHRLVVPRLWFLLDLGLFRGTQALLIVLIVLSSVMNAAVLTWAFRGLGHRGALLWALAATALGTALSPLAWENLVWGFQVQFVQVWMFAALAFAAVSFGDGDRRWLRVGIAAVCGVASTYSMANGLLVWPLLIALASWRGIRGGPFWLLAIIGVMVVAVEVAGFHTHPGHGDPIESMQHPIALAHYALRYLTNGVGQIGPLARDVLGAFLVSALVVMAVDAVVRRRRYRPEHGVLLAIAAFVVGAALLTALGRVSFGLWQADASRYATPSFLFMTSVFALLLDRVAALPWRVARPVAVTGGAVLLVLPALIAMGSLMPYVLGAADTRVNAVMTYISVGYRAGAMDALYPNKSVSPAKAFEFLDRNGVGPFADRARFMPPPEVLHGSVDRPPEACRGAVDRALSDPVNGVVLSGWAAAPDTLALPEWVVGTDASGKVAAWGSSLAWRPDVARALGTRWGGRGFEAVGRDPVDGPVAAIGIFSDGRRCRIAEPVRPSPKFLAVLPETAGAASDERWTVSEAVDPRRVGPEEPPAAARPAIGSLGPESRLAAWIDLLPSDGPAALLVPVRTARYPVAVRIVVRDTETGEEIDRYEFGAPSDRGWNWLILRGTAAAAGRHLRLQVSAAGPHPSQGVAVGRPYWIPAEAAR